MKPNLQKLASLAQEIYAHSSFSSLVQSLLPRDTFLRTYWHVQSNMPPDLLENKEKSYLTDAPPSDMPTNTVKLY